MNEYKASNGVVVRKDRTGFLSAHSGGVIITLRPREQDAFREFFRHKDDERLGRWRWSANPDYVVYHYHTDWATVLDEHDGTSHEYHRGDVAAARNHIPVPGTELAARAYFDAHPERKPWEDAKPGEVWVLSTADGRELAYAVMAVMDFGVVFESHDWRYPLSSDQIKDARRIWPEVVS